MTAAGVLLFSRTRDSTNAKSRLSSRYDPAFISKLHQAMVDLAVDNLLRASSSNKAAAWLGVEPLSLPSISGIESFWQVGSCFVERFCQAVQYGFSRSPGGLVIFGSDSPLLPLESIETALTLSAAGLISIVPSFRGGFGLLGLPRSARNFPLARVFERDDQIEAVKELAGKELLRLLPFSPDLDFPSDLDFIRQSLPNSGSDSEFGRLVSGTGGSY